MQEIRPWLLRLWTESWRSIPMGSFEDDDEMIAARIEMPLDLFQMHRKVLIRGWEKCSDFRLYHATVCEFAKGIVDWREAERKRKREYRDSKNKQLREISQEKPEEQHKEKSHGTSAGQTRDKCGKTTPSPSPSPSPEERRGAVAPRAKALVQSSESETDQNSEIRGVFEHWKTTNNKPPNAKLTRKRKGKISARLAEGYSAEDLKRAIDGNKASDWHQGKNPNGTVYDDLELILRDSGKVDMFASKASSDQRRQDDRAAFLAGDRDPRTIDGECRHVD